MRFDRQEKEALKYAFKNFKGKVYVFGSRLNTGKKGGDIDIMVVPDEKVNALKLSIDIQKRFFSRCEQKLDVIVYKKDNPFCREVMNNAKRLNIKTIH
jgi:predicted nucleotidyltransferase